MPCLECENKMWRFGETGKCEYSTKSECQEANVDYYAESKLNSKVIKQTKHLIGLLVPKMLMRFLAKMVMTGIITQSGFYLSMKMQMKKLKIGTSSHLGKMGRYTGVP